MPRVGEHTILLGRPTNVEDKLGRMKEFYTEGLNKVGWNKYSQISLKLTIKLFARKIRNDMAVEKEIIVAIEFGSSKIRGVAGCKNIDGSVQVLDIEQVDARNCIRKGVVYNIDKTVMCLKHIVDKMENALEMRVRKVFVGIGGQSLRTKKNTVSRQFATKTVVSQELVDSLLKTNRNTVYAGYEILEVVPQEYHVGLDTTVDPVGS